MKKIEVILMKAINPTESQEFTLSLNEDIQLRELSEYLRREWRVLPDHQIYYSQQYADNRHLD
jgi:hypothetical protein